MSLPSTSCVCSISSSNPSFEVGKYWFDCGCQWVELVSLDIFLYYRPPFAMDVRIKGKVDLYIHILNSRQCPKNIAGKCFALFEAEPIFFFNTSKKRIIFCMDCLVSCTLK